ncbi:MAG TPA: hypothetical protein VGC42_01240 [Kofleriaceae bacterium]
MQGIDEPSARSALAAMQDRLARDPTSALGVSANASAEDIRAAFLELTKLFHPVRFGRMAIDVQKLSNEVFLALRSAHDALAKTARRRSGQIPTLAAPGIPAPSAPSRLPVSQVTPAARPGGLPARSLPPRSAEASGERPPVLPRTITPTAAVLQRGVPVRPVAAPPVARPPALTTAPTRPAGPPASEAAVLDLLQRQQFDPAKSMLHQLQARDPSSRKVRALMCYARGREAQLDRRLDDARVELQDALDLDPELTLAKTALTELFTRRR